MGGAGSGGRERASNNKVNGGSGRGRERSLPSVAFHSLYEDVVRLGEVKRFTDKLDHRSDGTGCRLNCVDWLELPKAMVP